MIDLSQITVAVVLGAGPVADMAADAMGGKGLVLVYEPDEERRRAVKATRHYKAVGTPAEVPAALIGFEIVSMLGCCIIEPPDNLARIGEESAAAFYRALIDAYETHSVAAGTTAGNSKVFIRNQIDNLERYVESDGLTDLRHARKGQPAICIAAGPSLARNIDLLTDPSVRERFTIIAVQTVLARLLEKGIRPHYVTALDYSTLSAGFYEGLTPEAVRGVDLVVSPSGNAAILNAWPGRLRCTQSGYLDDLLGPEFGRVRGELHGRGTVAHMSYQLARYMGCDPVILVGQDLAFTDGRYYAEGVGRMFDHEKLKTKGGALRECLDIHGNTLATNQQMQTYRAQFEQTFAEDNARGLVTIDATEGGARKAGARTSTLADVLRDYGKTIERDGFAEGMGACGRMIGFDERRRALYARVCLILAEVERIAALARRALPLLAQGAYDAVHGLGREVMGLDIPYALVQYLDQPGAFNRLRADRLHQLNRAADPPTRQRLQVERDAANLRSMADAADLLAEMLGTCLARLEPCAAKEAA